MQKVKFKHWGQVGCVQFAWDKSNGRYYKGTPNTDNWLTYNEQKPIENNTNFLNDIIINNLDNPF